AELPKVSSIPDLAEATVTKIWACALAHPPHTSQAFKTDVIADSSPYVSLTPTVVAIYSDEVTGAYYFPHLRAPPPRRAHQQSPLGAHASASAHSRSTSVSSVSLPRRPAS